MKTKINTKAESEESSAAATLGSMGTAREHLHAQYQPSPPGPIPSHLTSSFGGSPYSVSRSTTISPVWVFSTNTTITPNSAIPSS